MSAVARTGPKPGIGIVHIGPGAFHRAHQAVFTHNAMQRSGGDWGIVGMSINSSDVHDALCAQDFAYNLVIQQPQPHYQQIEAMCDVLVAPQDPQAVLRLLADGAVHIISLTITEKGYRLTDTAWADLQRPDAPVTALGFLLHGLAHRCRAGAGPVTILSCDNVSGNGDVCRDAVLRMARAYDNALADWIDRHVQFPNTMVDAITPATTDALRAQVQSAIGTRDCLPVQREPFAQWVIEDFDGPRPDWAGVGVRFTKDVKAFEHAKLRLLNGPHSALAYMGLARGYETVAQAMTDPAIRRFLLTLTDTEIIPGLTATDDMDLYAYRDAILDRFGNPAIAHALAQIAQDGSQKLAIRIAAPMAENLASGRPAHALAAVLLAWFDHVANNADRLVDPKKDELVAAQWNRQWPPARKAQALWLVFEPCFSAAQREPFIAQVTEAA